MKALNIDKIFFLGFFISILSCKAQTLPLNTALKDILANAYVKDLNNKLTPYLGTYKANFQGNEIILYLTKTENKLVDYGDQKFYRDAIIIKYIVKNSSGTVLQDTKNTTSKIEFFSIGTRPYQNSVIFSYSGTNCNVGWGKVILKKLNDNQITWEYRPNDIILDDSKCPQGTDINIYLPETKDLIFTKQ